MSTLTINGVWWPRAKKRSPNPCKMLIIPEEKEREIHLLQKEQFTK